MSNWERKDADTLADAISIHISYHPDMVEDNELLAIVQDAVVKVANAASTTPVELNRLRAVVCAICRGSNLYDCDVPEGWSSNCEFIFANTTEFAGL